MASLNPADLLKYVAAEGKALLNTGYGANALDEINRKIAEATLANDDADGADQ